MARFTDRPHSPSLTEALHLRIDARAHIPPATRKLSFRGPRVDVRALITPLLQHTLTEQSRGRHHGRDDIPLGRTIPRDTSRLPHRILARQRHPVPTIDPCGPQRDSPIDRHEPPRILTRCRRTHLPNRLVGPCTILGRMLEHITGIHVSLDHEVKPHSRALLEIFGRRTMRKPIAVRRGTVLKLAPAFIHWTHRTSLPPPRYNPAPQEQDPSSVHLNVSHNNN